MLAFPLLRHAEEAVEHARRERDETRERERGAEVEVAAEGLCEHRDRGEDREKHECEYSRHGGWLCAPRASEMPRKRVVRRASVAVASRSREIGARSVAGRFAQGSTERGVARPSAQD